MPSIAHRRTLIWAVVGLLAAASIWAAFFSPAAGAEAYQPIGIRVSESEMPEPPCTYWHDDACETVAPPLYSVNPFQSGDPHAESLHIGSGYHDHRENLKSVARLSQQVSASLAGSGDASKEADSEPKGPGGDVSYAITSDITGLPWIRDGVTEAEAVTGLWLAELDDYNPSLVTTLTRMPFLQDHTPGDLQAIQTLTLISAGTPSIDPNPQYATALANHAAFADGGGIDNTEARIIAVAAMPYLQGADALIDLLASQGSVEELSVQGQHDNSLMFAIVRPMPFNSTTSSGGSSLGPKEPQKEPFIPTASNQSSALMQSLHSATEHAETVMAQALPVDFVGILVADSAIFDGANNGIHLWMDDCFDGTNCSDRYRQYVIAHEIGHYWWGTGDYYLHENWISEGVASYIGAYSVRTQFNLNNLSTSYWPCPYYRTIEHLRADNPHYGVSQGSLCNYSLGERLFINLDRNMGHTEFTAGFRNLHQRLSTYEDDPIDQGISLMNSFCSSCLSVDTNMGAAGYTLARWYGEKILTDSSAATGTIAGFGSPLTVSLTDVYDYNRQYGIPQVSASGPDQRRWLTLSFSNVLNPPETVTVRVVQYHEDRYPYYQLWQERPVYSRDELTWFNAYLGAPARRAPGHHWVYIYNEDGEKIAEAEYQVLP